MTKGGGPKKLREGASSLNPKEKKFKKPSFEKEEVGKQDRLIMDAAVAAAEVVMTPFKDLTEE
eukprot:3906333-Karenia_brevis.AAC.1